MTMDYIINPMWFYWLQAVSAVQIALGVIAGLLGVALMVAIVAALSNLEYGTDDKDFILGKRMCLIIFPIFFVTLLATLLIPSRETMISMMVAKYATLDNAQTVVDGIKSAADYIINAIKEVTP